MNSSSFSLFYDFLTYSLMRKIIISFPYIDMCLGFSHKYVFGFGRLQLKNSILKDITVINDN